MVVPSLSSLKEKRAKLEKHIATKIPGFQIKAKNESALMKTLALFLFFVKGFLTKFTTTWFPDIYFPRLPYKMVVNEAYNEALMIITISHEYIHLKDRKRLWWLFNLLYLSPQVFAVVGLFGFFFPILFLALLFALPLPSLGRAYLEYRGYRTSMAVTWWLLQTERTPESMTAHFTSADYYYMMPFKKYMIRKFEKDMIRIKNDDLTEELRELKTVLFE